MCASSFLGSCDGSQLVECQTASGNAVENACSGYYALCGNGVWSDPMPVSPGTMCLRGVLVHSDTCSSVITSAPEPTAECSFTDYLCVNSAGQAQTGETSYYRTCVEGKLSAILSVPEGMLCSQGVITRTGLSTISPRICDGSSLIECQTLDGTAVSGSCSEFYALCGNGYWSQPMFVSPGTMCLNGALVHSDKCSSITTSDPSGSTTDSPSGSTTDSPSGSTTDSPSGSTTDSPSGGFSFWKHHGFSFWTGK